MSATCAVDRARRPQTTSSPAHVAVTTHWIIFAPPMRRVTLPAKLSRSPSGSRVTRCRVMGHAPRRRAGGSESF